MNIGSIKTTATMELNFTDNEISALKCAYSTIATIIVKAGVLNRNNEAQTRFVIDFEEGAKYTYSVSDLCNVLEVLDGFIECNGYETSYLETVLDNEPIE